MSKNYYKVYIESVIALAQTLCIKSQQSASILNSYIVAKYGEDGVDQNDLSSWKYYKNICGLYHYDDEMIYVTSLDTLQTIPFTKDSLSIHKATARAYAFGTRFYRELVSLYPTKEQLILGVLYPADMDTAINSDNGTILSYPQDYIQTNEVSLIFNIQTWVKKWLSRWDNPQYNISDSLYSAANHAIMYLNLVPVILNLRLKACKTPEAHLFHIREYLASHGMLDKYINSLTLKQSLFLYRNIAYIERNNGKNYIFKWLITNILTQRGIPLTNYLMRHDTTDLYTNYTSTPTFRQQALNLEDRVTNSDIISLQTLLNKEDPDAPGNPDYNYEHVDDINDDFKYSLSSVVATKVLESSMISYTNTYGVSLDSILINHWLYLSSVNVYNAYVTIKNPQSGADILLSAKDSFIYAFYCFCKTIKINPTVIPTFLASRVRKLTIPQKSQLMSVVDSGLIKEEKADFLYTLETTIPVLDSVDSFYSKCRELYDIAQKEVILVSNQENYKAVSMLTNMILQFYGDYNCDLVTPGMTFYDFIQDRELPNIEFTQDEYYVMYLELVANGTGASLNDEESVASIQKAMIGIMKQLSSYSVQYITEIEGQSVTQLGWKNIRITPPISKEKSLQEVTEFSVDIYNVNHKEKDRFDLPFVIKGEIATFSRNNFVLDLPVYITETRNSLIEKVKFRLGNISFNNDLLEANRISTTTTKFNGYETFDLLTDEQKKKAVDIYCRCADEVGPRKISISDTVLETNLGGFEFMGNVDSIIDGFEYQSIPSSSNGAFTTTFTHDDINAFFSIYGTTEVPGFKTTGELTIANQMHYVNNSYT